MSDDHPRTASELHRVPGDDAQRTLWADVDRYVTDRLHHAEDDALTAALRAAADAGLPPINVSPPQGKLLYLLARMHGARTILEIGTLAGYSTIWLARALPADGRLVSLEVDPAHAAVARQNLERAGLSDRTDVLVGPAIKTLATLAEDPGAPFDLVFIDADKPSCPDYFTEALQLTRPGSVIITDNVVRQGALADSSTTDSNVQGVRALHELISNEPRVDATTIQTVGDKGYDGFTIALVVE